MAIEALEAVHHLGMMWPDPHPCCDYNFGKSSGVSSRDPMKYRVGG